MVALVVAVACIVGGCACIVMARNGLFVAFTKLLQSEELQTRRLVVLAPDSSMHGLGIAPLALTVHLILQSTI